MNKLPPWLTKSKLDYEKDEANWAKRRKGRKQSNSGRGWVQKADVQDAILLTDCKETTRLAFSLSRTNLYWLQEMAAKQHKSPHYKIKFIDEESGKTTEWSTIPTALLEQLLECFELHGDKPEGTI